MVASGNAWIVLSPDRGNNRFARACLRPYDARIGRIIRRKRCAALVERANRWIAENGIDVLNVESLSTFSAGDDTSVSHWYSGIRVWYRTT
ncbi:hypothetical protein BKIR_c94_2830 [Candidatus Paraburkholderia kirkii UZHbot1]|uniref:Uncharacterized protein n=1 Tax=Candidatus Paraburkholderia kirkii UZHbot1 TaxID=1055526 RepID=G4MJN8_9BURK|nr:hypothetical protein BKIR_c94_2830 [Candidatus Paraburkholderia kirkii UZHbot1]